MWCALRFTGEDERRVAVGQGLIKNALGRVFAPQGAARRFAPALFKTPRVRSPLEAISQ